MNKHKLSIYLIVSLLVCSLLSGCNTTTPMVENTTVSSSVLENEVENSKEITKSSEIDKSKDLSKSDDVTKSENLLLNKVKEPTILDNLIVKFIDVGQADSCIILTPNNDVILIDTGEKKDADTIINELGSYEFKDIDLMVLSHPHADHIGGAEELINTYETKEVLMSSYPATTKLFDSLLDSLEEKNTLVTPAELGLSYDIDGVHIEVVGVDSLPQDNNNSSVVVKVSYGDIDMLFTGDAEEQAESIILNNGFDLECEILKLGHHGSDTSTSEDFLDAVNPSLGIISVGVGNKYNHPSIDTINKLKNRDIKYYRTDEVGSIQLEIDGSNIVSSLEDSLSTSNARSFLFAPAIAEVHLEDEGTVLNNVQENE